MTESWAPGQAAAVASCISGFMHEDELIWLAEAASTRPTIIEIGSWKGRSTKALAMATPGVVYAVDNWGGNAMELQGQTDPADSPDKVMHEFLWNMRDEIRCGKVVPLRMKSDDAVDILKALLKSRGRQADMIFIDGDHDEISVERDISNYRPLLEPGGILSGHDYCPGFPGVILAVQKNVSGVMVTERIWYAQV